MKLLICVLALLTTACSSVNALGTEMAPAQPLVAAQAEQYRLGVADKVRVLVYDEPTLSGEFVVNSDGNLSLPLIGDVKAQGRTAAELGLAVQNALSEGYLRHPKVSLEVLIFRPFYILGEVNKPGEYPSSNGLTVLNAVATAGGFTYRAEKHHYYVKYAGQTSEHKLSLDPASKVYPGDTIRIGERYF